MWTRYYLHQAGGVNVLEAVTTVEYVRYNSRAKFNLVIRCLAWEGCVFLTLL